MEKSRSVKTLAHDTTKKCAECGQNLGRIVELDVEGGDLLVCIVSEAFCWEDACKKCDKKHARLAPLSDIHRLFLKDAPFAEGIDDAIEQLEQLKKKFS